MNLRSRKIQSRRVKRAPCRFVVIKDEGVDIISRLPDALLTYILSLLPDADANRTRVLSNRWKNLWLFLPNLHFVMPFCWSIGEVKKFHDSVDQALALRGGMPIEKFFLYCSKNCDYDRVYGWLSTIVKCKVHELELRFPADRFRARFCWDLFKTCNTLVALTLRGEFVLDVPQAELLFPCLKKINLVSILYSGDESIVNLISGCPVLEELFVERQVIGQFDNLQTFKVSSPSLKRLRISFALCILGNYRVVIDAPKLEYIYILDVMSTDYSLTMPMSLVEANIKARTDSNTESIAQIVAILSPVKILTLTDSTLMALSYVHNLNIPTFANLIKFVVGIDCLWGWNLLPTLLHNMPNLEHITFSDGLVPFPRIQYAFNMNWVPPEYVPGCLRHKITEITICNREPVIQEEFGLIRYLLQHSTNLRIFRINGHRNDSKSRERLLSLPRGSNQSRVEFV
ncbi:F-box/LRR-repeat protein At3g59190-like isoform X1 [Cynara cardunculus var. scolymus]|uniref:F-box/LRR-repeat protein At3g59190-like isoform X1 n=1 Tax=Cynara cardunculus var. scolymus TaxID=59895 RepID=UPI000D626438|nr:F-box/LRR-repeat protein At3g59190-like isoform X1 [Cynara cardunculus var. scolymus]